MYLSTMEGIIEVPESGAIKRFFCRHEDQITGEACAKNGMRRISGEDIYTVCRRCGKILREIHTQYE